MGDDRFSAKEPDSRNLVPPDRDVDNGSTAGLSRRDFIAAGSAGVAGATLAPDGRGDARCTRRDGCACAIGEEAETVHAP